MPHLQVDRLRTVHQLNFGCWKGSSDFPFQEVTVGVLDLTAALTFAIGSIGFLPQFADNLSMFLAGCVLFFIGSLILFLVSLYALVEAYQHHRALTFEVMEAMLYALGSWVFLVGTLLYWPEKAKYEHIETLKGFALGQYFNLFEPQFEGSVLFTVGSVMFVFACFANALNPHRLQKELNQMFTTVSALDMFGNMLFVIGSTAFMPECITPAESRIYLIGAWCFEAGSLFLCVGCSLSLYRTVRLWRVGEMRRLLPNDQKQVS